MNLTRRKFLAGIAAVAAAPLIAKADVLAAVKTIDPEAVRALLQLRMLRAHQMMMEAMSRDLFSITGASDMMLGEPSGLEQLVTMRKSRAVGYSEIRRSGFFKPS